jgi:hypothetical protein
MKSGVFVNNTEFDFEDFNPDSKFFSADMSVSNYVESKKKDGWTVIEDGLVNTLLNRKANGSFEFLRVISSGDSDIQRIFKRDKDKILGWSADNDVSDSHIRYLPIVFILKDGKPSRKGGVQVIEVSANKNIGHGESFKHMSIFESKEEEENVLSNVCPTCFMEKANGHCLCDIN